MSMISKNFQFTIHKCKNKLSCKNETEIDEWIKDVSIDSWVQQQSIEFEEHVTRPIFYNIKYLKTWLLNPDINQYVYSMAKKNIFNTKDSWFPNIES
jgi:hypothetical protein